MKSCVNGEKLRDFAKNFGRFGPAVRERGGELPNSAGDPDARLDVGPARLVNEPLVLDLFRGASAK